MSTTLLDTLHHDPLSTSLCHRLLYSHGPVDDCSLINPTMTINVCEPFVSLLATPPWQSMSELLYFNIFTISWPSFPRWLYSHLAFWRGMSRVRVWMVWCVRRACLWSLEAKCGVWWEVSNNFSSIVFFIPWIEMRWDWEHARDILESRIRLMPLDDDPMNKWIHSKTIPVSFPSYFVRRMLTSRFVSVIGQYEKVDYWRKKTLERPRLVLDCQWSACSPLPALGLFLAVSGPGQIIPTLSTTFQHLNF